MSSHPPSPARDPTSPISPITPPTTSPSYDAANPSTSSMLQETARRERCAHILNSWEMLAWYAGTYQESIPQTRLRFLKLMIGMEEEGSEDEDWGEEGEEGGNGGNGGGGKKSGKGKGKEKYSGDDGMPGRRGAFSWKGGVGGE